MRRPAPLLLAFAFGLLCRPALADTADDDHHPQQDKVTLALAAEDWVNTTTARVTARIDASLPGSDAAKVRGDMQKALASLTNGADWRFARFDHSQDQSGLETWHADLETRLKESDIGGLADKAKNASKPGLQIKIGAIDFTPTLAENEAVKAKLRGQLYGAINDELKHLNDAEPGRNFRVGEVEFEAPEVQPVQPFQPQRMQVMLAGTAAPAPEPPPIAVQEKITMTATVTLEAVPPK